MSSMSVEPLHECLGARITGVDLSTPLDDETTVQIQAALDRYSLLCFPNQAMNDDAQLAFTKRFGEPEPNHVKYGATGVIDYWHGW